MSAPPLPKLLLAIKNPPGSCNDPKGKQNGGSRCSLEFEYSYNIQKNANRIITYLTAQWFVLSTNFSTSIPFFRSFFLLLNYTQYSSFSPKSIFMIFEQLLTIMHQFNWAIKLFALKATWSPYSNTRCGLNANFTSLNVLTHHYSNT